MIIIRRGVLIPFLVLVLFLGSCGTRDYDEVENDKNKINGNESGEIIKDETQKRKETKVKKEYQEVTEEEPIVPSGNGGSIESPYFVAEQGYLWDGMEWIGVSDEHIDYLQESLIDNEHTSDYSTMGTALIGGAILGIIIRSSGSWILGKPIEYPPKHPFWQKLEKVIKTTTKGGVRGGALAGAIHLALSGLPALSYKGLLGLQYGILSCSVALGSLSAIASGTVFNNINKGDWSQPNSFIGKWIHNNSKHGKNTMDNLQKWTTETEIGQFARYKIAPGVFVIGISTGVGLIVYNSL